MNTFKPQPTQGRRESFRDFPPAGEFLLPWDYLPFSQSKPTQPTYYLSPHHPPPPFPNKPPSIHSLPPLRPARTSRKPASSAHTTRWHKRRALMRRTHTLLLLLLRGRWEALRRHAEAGRGKGKTAWEVGYGGVGVGGGGKGGEGDATAGHRCWGKRVG